MRHAGVAPSPRGSTRGQVGASPRGRAPSAPARVLARLGGLVALVVVCGLVMLLGRSTRIGFEVLPPQSAAPSACERAAPRTAEGYAAAFASLPGGWVAGDQGSSTVLPDGRVLWVFADTLVRTGGGTVGGEVLRFVHSSFVIQSAGCFTTVLGPDGDGILPTPGSGGWYWPQHAVARGTTLWVTALRVFGRGFEQTDFRLAGMDLAEFEVVPGGVPRFVALHRTPASDAGDFGVLWGAAVAVDGEQLYVYGTRRVRDRALVGKQLLLARVPIDRIADQAAWRFRTGHGWDPDPRRAEVLLSADPGVSTALSAHRTAHGWVLVTKRGEFLGDAVIALAAPRPWGPFDTQVLIASQTRGSSLEYLPLAHPEAELSDGSLLVSLNHNDSSLADVLADPATFRPSFHALPGLGRPVPAVTER